MMTYSGINHIALVTKDMDATLRFWRDLLCMRLVAGTGRRGNRQYFLNLSDSVLIAFFEWPEAEPVPDKDPGRPAGGPIVFDHLCIEVSSKNDLWQLKDRLQAADIWVTEVLDNGFIYSIFSTDPNGIQLEFCCRIDEFDIREKLRMKDPDPSLVAQEGPGPFPEKWPAVKKPPSQAEKKVYRGQLKNIFEEE